MGVPYRLEKETSIIEVGPFGGVPCRLEKETSVSEAGVHILGLESVFCQKKKDWKNRQANQHSSSRIFFFLVGILLISIWESFFISKNLTKTMLEVTYFV